MTGCVISACQAVDEHRYAVPEGTDPENDTKSKCSQNDWTSLSLTL
jgi:hypothetical protein